MLATRSHLRRRAVSHTNRRAGQSHRTTESVKVEPYCCRMSLLPRRIAGAVAALTALVLLVWPAQPAQATTPVLVDVATVYFHGGSTITMTMRVALPAPLRARGTCKMSLIKVTTTDLGGGVVGTSYQLVATHSSPCEYSTSPQWGDRRAIWSLNYPYGESDYVAKAEFIYGNLYGNDYRSFSTIP